MPFSIQLCDFAIWRHKESNVDRFEELGDKYRRDGVAKERGLKNLCRKKLCIISTDKQLILDLMHEASIANDCYQVEVYKNERLNVYLGTSTYTNESSLGDAWARYESHPKAWAIVQDDDFCDRFKDRIRSY